MYQNEEDKFTKAGYARVSAVKQNSEIQMDASYKEERERIFEERASGVKSNRDRLKGAVRSKRGGDTLVVWKSDRVSKALEQLKNIINLLNEKWMISKGLQ